jgi:type IV pilus assembly protein PilE
MNTHKRQGFSLFELLITCSIIAILTSIALPTYQDYLHTTYRNEAKITLMRVSAALAQYQAKHDSLKQASLQALGWSPSIAEGRYTLTLQNVDTQHFTLRATPHFSDHCGSLTINEQGKRTPTHGQCW